MRAALVSLLVGSALALTAGCGGDQKPAAPQVSGREADASVAGESSPSVEQEPVGPTDEDLRQFVELSDTNDPSDTAKALRLTAPNSAANAVLTVWLARDKARQLAGGEAAQPSRITGGDGRFKVCSKEPPCQVFSGFKAKGDLIADFAIDGHGMRDRVILGSSKKYRVGDLATARLIGSYESVSTGGVSIVFDISARTDVTFGWTSDAYVNPNGTQLSPSDTITPGTLRAGSKATIYYYLDAEAAELGGDLYMTAVEDGGAQRDVEVKIPTG